MSRVIAGVAQGQKLAVPKSGTRPTSDRVKEAMFSTLDHYGLIAEQTRVLDLYAGSGALGIEMLSRGCKSATFVDMSHAAIKCIKSNVDKCQFASAQTLESEAKVVIAQAKVDSYLIQAVENLQRSPEQMRNDMCYEVVFIDPPYDLSEEKLSYGLSLLAQLLTTESIAVIERSARSPEPKLDDRLEIFNVKNYGETVLYYVQLAIN